MTAKHWLIADEKANDLSDNYFIYRSLFSEALSVALVISLEMTG